MKAVEWDGLRGDLRKAYSTVKDYLAGVDTWGEDEVSVGWQSSRTRLITWARFLLAVKTN